MLILAKEKNICYTNLVAYLSNILKLNIFRDSSMVEQLTVNQLVPGSSPGRGAEQDKEARKRLFCFHLRLEFAILKPKTGKVR